MPSALRLDQLLPSVLVGQCQGRGRSSRADLNMGRVGLPAKGQRRTVLRGCELDVGAAFGIHQAKQDSFRIGCAVRQDGRRVHFQACANQNLMSRMKPIIRSVLLVIMIGFVTCIRLQHAFAESEVIDENRRRFSIAVLDFSESLPSDDASRSNIAQAIASDSKASGRFALIELNGPSGERADAVPLRQMAQDEC